MSAGRHARRLSFRLRAPKDYVWTSDDGFDNAINHFARGRTFRRQVGLAPGPLEARKRAAKRRMVDMAQVKGGGQIDPSLLGGTGYAPSQNGWQWQSPMPPSIGNIEGAVFSSQSIVHTSANDVQSPHYYHAGLPTSTLPKLLLISLMVRRRSYTDNLQRISLYRWIHNSLMA